MRVVLSIVFSLLTAASSYGQTVTDGSAGAISAVELQSLYKVLPDFLKDPESARLTKLHKDPDNQDYV
ncbi:MULTISPECIES: hypothetical protein [unclassified Rhizobium]|uniref:hypothetical protein n=1 Tax=unclassified Rhizobium TaxID=2613769 RepID=UPI0007126DE6|nr:MULTISPECIES: hypothetical protein [unclassified Rhizobium]KQS84121.1 hypothetical protein ASG50_29980 [Rhizobium sp. Leaf386]KQT03216.1 hypothetical protein ASG42_24725 [Rhizobium sp. Leaf391]KQU08389.1 hypothetical protein ASG68_22635 [Rhizobium sp. Leaf453]